MGNPPLRRSKSAATVDSLRKCHNGYRVAEGTFGTSLVHESKSFVTIERPFRLEYQNCHSPTNAQAPLRKLRQNAEEKTGEDLVR
ncbi:hypothetical protein AVEN_20486-1 [Araneus ventricosus]|uniref:Uncharacterized protein n=1 Tax=Araneus ventricosus TaxID=182803 RepID=A0A4Y2SXJ8_ARAVE|nr:hypothetical protein AVEN_234704-1 [Araneus ventricosus]GBN92016.1 hypothetical protein AVEN_20486-1 [Araneus ventricosus]